MLVASTFDDVVLVSLLLTLNSPLHCADFSVIDFEQVNAGWESPIVYAITLSKKNLSENHNNEICQYSIVTIKPCKNKTKQEQQPINLY